MTNEEMRIEIAKACGWTQVRMQNVSYLSDLPSEAPYAIPPNGSRAMERIPNYPEDLNACREFELSFTGVCEWTAYTNKLIEILDAGQYRNFVTDTFRLIIATPAQRCEAFLKTKGLWKEEGK